MPLLVVARLWLREGARVAEFEAFEREAVARLAAHGARIERVVRRRGEGEAGATPKGGRAEDAPFEVHLLSFPSETAFAAWRADPDVRAMAARREALIARTEVFVGEAYEGYGAPRPDGDGGAGAAAVPAGR